MPVLGPSFLGKERLRGYQTTFAVILSIAQMTYDIFKNRLNEKIQQRGGIWILSNKAMRCIKRNMAPKIRHQITTLSTLLFAQWGSIVITTSMVLEESSCETKHICTGCIACSDMENTLVTSKG
ncbi:hypothetical protein ACJQWK_00612 [Exserohilum turcicum]